MDNADPTQGEELPEAIAAVMAMSEINRFSHVGNGWLQ